MEARGQDCNVSILDAEGEEVQAFKLLVDWTWTVSLEVDERNYIGEKTPRIRTILGSTSLEMNTEPDGADWQVLVDLEIAKAKGDADALERVVNVAFTCDHKNGDVARRLMRDCRLTGISLSSGGRTEVLTLNPTFVSSDSVRIS